MNEALSTCVRRSQYLYSIIVHYGFASLVISKQTTRDTLSKFSFKFVMLHRYTCNNPRCEKCLMYRSV